MSEIEGQEGPVAPEVPAPDATEPRAAGEAPAAEPEPASSGGPSRPLIVVAAALLVVATFLGVLAARYNAELNRERDERQEVEQVAARFSAAFFTYDYRTLDASLERIKRDATRKYGGDFERVFKTSIATLITATQARSSGTITDVFLGSIDDETASALTVVNVQREGAGGRLPLAGQYLQLDLVKQRGAWRVDNVTAVDLTQSGESAPAATTTTSVPK
ncbi:MAG: Mce-associated rane protein [Actinomycetota bacterium]|jgi:hypothetical protein